MRRYCLALDLIDDKSLITEYVDFHKRVWPEVLESIKKVGITNMEIYLFSNRLFMVMEVEDDFSFLQKQQMDESIPKVREWERLMWKYQQPIQGAAKGEKWVLMDKIFEFKG